MSVSISQKSIFLTIFGFLVVLAFWQLRSLVLSLILSYILMAGFRPLIHRSQKFFGLGYRTAASLVYFTFVIAFLGLMATFLGPFVSQFQLLVSNFPNIVTEFFTYTESWGIGITPDQAQQALTPALQQIISHIINLTIGSISVLLFSVSLFVMTFYFILEHDDAVKYIASFFPSDSEKIIQIERVVERKVGLWVLGQVIIAFLVGVVTFVGLLVFGVNYFVPLTLLAFFLSPIAGIGPLLATIPAVVIASVQNPITGLWIFVYYNIVQTIKDNFVVPKLTSETVGLDPFMILFALLVGLSLFGILGAIVSVPAAVGIGVIVEEILKKDD